jgi:hypothetical protein
MERPDKLPLWAIEGIIEEPSDEKKQKGWGAERAYFPFFNYWQNKVYQWINYLASKPAFTTKITAEETTEAKVFDEIILDASSGDKQVYFPQKATLGDKIRVLDYGNTWSYTNMVQINAIPFKVNGDPLFYAMISPNEHTEFIFDGIDNWIPFVSERKNDFLLPFTKLKSVGMENQIQVGHILTEKSFPSIPDSNLSFYNLSNHLDQSTNGRNFINNNAQFNGSGIFGDPTLCLYADRYFSSVNPFFNPGNFNFTFGLWLTPLANAGVILSQKDSFKLIYKEGKVQLLAFDGSFWLESSLYPLSSWCHLVVKYIAAKNTFQIFINGKMQGELNQNLCASSSPLFMLGDKENSLRGYYDEFFFAQALFDEVDIKKIYSAKISHNTNILPENQTWSLWKKTEKGNVRPILDYPIWGIDSTDIYLDFAQEPANTEIALKMKFYR